MKILSKSHFTFEYYSINIENKSDVHIAQDNRYFE